MKQGDIVIINFPFTNLESSKVRPALIVSNKSFNNKKNILLLAISTQKWNKDFAVALSQGDLSEWELNKDSFIRMHNILSLEKRLIIKKVAKIKESKLDAVKWKVISFIQ